MAREREVPEILNEIEGKLRKHDEMLERLAKKSLNSEENTTKRWNDYIECPEGVCGFKVPFSPFGVIKTIDHRVPSYINPIKKRLDELHQEQTNIANRFNSESFIDGIHNRVAPKVIDQVKKVLKIEEPKKEEEWYML